MEGTTTQSISAESPRECPFFEPESESCAYSEHPVLVAMTDTEGRCPVLDLTSVRCPNESIDEESADADESER